MSKPKKRGRKPSGQPKKMRINICLSKEAYEKLHRIAAPDSASSWIQTKIEQAKQPLASDDSQ